MQVSEKNLLFEGEGGGRGGSPQTCGQTLQIKGKGHGL